ncbi:MAG TPA: hypothetical protein VHO90_12765 [Bacteroidales bacterium]|nr:hypothetical protein [Bacteroidales bacterium]
MKKIILLLVPFLVSSCAYNYVEEIHFRDNNTADVKLGLDFSKSLNSEQKDLIIDLISKTTKGFAEAITGQKVDSAVSINKTIDQLFSQAKDSLKPVFYEMAFDTLLKITKDSLYVSIQKGDSLNQLTPKQEKMVGDLTYYLFRKALVRLNMDINKKVMLFEFEFRNVSWDSLNHFNIAAFKKGGELAAINEKYTSLTDLFPEWKGNTITRSNNNLNVTDVKGAAEPDEQTKKAMKDSYFIVRYYLPSKVRKCNNSLYKKINSGTTLEFNHSFYDMFKGKQSVSAVITY